MTAQDRNESNVVRFPSQAGTGFPLLTEGESLRKTEREHNSEVLQLSTEQPQGAWGIDRLSLSFPLKVEPRAELFASVTQRQGELSANGQTIGGRTYGVMVDVESQYRAAKGASGPTVFVGASQVGDDWWGKVEMNPSRLWDPEGCSLAPVETLELGAQLMVQAALGYVWPACDMGEMRTKRLDLARDFRGIRNVGMYVRGLQNVKRSYLRGPSVLYADPVRGNAETLWVGNKAGGCRLYDQYAAYADKGAPEGSLRWELEAREDWISRELHSNTLGRVTADGLLAMARKRWEWSRMGTEVTAAGDVVQVVDTLVCRHPKVGGKRECGCDGISQAVADRLLGQLVRESLGLRRQTSNDTASTYEKLKRRLGVVPSAELFAAATAFEIKGRLDFDYGTEVAA